MIDHKIILYHANWSFCSQMVRVALSEKGLAFKKKHIKLCDQYPEGENIHKDFLAINPLGTVPAIKIDEKIRGNFVIEQVGAGHREHIYTSAAAFKSIIKFFDDKMTLKRL